MDPPVRHRGGGNGADAGEDGSADRPPSHRRPAAGDTSLAWAPRTRGPFDTKTLHGLRY